MADIMRPVSLAELFTRSFAEYRQKKSIFDIPEEHFYRPFAGANASAGAVALAPIFSSSAANPIGPAAGPHTQLAQNILTSYLTGSRYFELKTVQILDTLEIEKPCIDIRDEGYNVEWSSEFTLDKAYDEYLKAWFLLHVFDFLLFGNSPDKPPSFLFNMSVGYDLEGIKSEKMDRFINRLIDSSDDELFAKYAEVIRDLPAELFAGTPWLQNAENIQEVAEIVPAKLCESVTLSTMHGCPPGEIEAICRYMITEKKLDTLVKLNPTLLGFDRVRSILDNLGFDYVSLKREGFEVDLQYPDAVPMLKRLKALAEKEGRFFGVKLTNTLAAANDGSVLPGDEMYLSGRALYPLTINLADQLVSEFDGELPMSFSGGVSAWNIEDVVRAGIKPVTIATDLLRPGGFSRLKEIAERAENKRNAWSLDRVDPELVRKAAADSLSAEYLAKDFRGSQGVSVPEDLPFTDCFVAPCIVTCPISQDVPEYVHLAGEGRYEEAFGIIYDRNPLPFMTGYLCDHECTDNCTRLDWEGAVDIRDMKRIAAEQGYEAFRKSGSLTERQAASRGTKAAIIGAGPAGLSAAAFLAREGIEVHVFEKEARSGGVLSYVIPQFRVPEKTVERDLSLLEDLGVVFHYNCGDKVTASELKERGFSYVIAGIGAELDRSSSIDGALEVLDFLRKFHKDPSKLSIGPSVAIIGAGDTAMDAARAAKRCSGVEKVIVLYRRSISEMSATREEYETVINDDIPFKFLCNPVRWDGPGRLVCQVMELGEPDAGGRSRPVPTGREEILEIDTVVSSIGTDVDAEKLVEIGVEDRDTAEASGIFVVGDAAAGASTIVKAIASARQISEKILAGEGGERFDVLTTTIEGDTPLRSRRDHLIPVSKVGDPDDAIRAAESHRCLGCRALCLKCVEVCPNRANTFIEIDGFQDDMQIVHIDAFCNECGNCGTFCPWDGDPYLDKLTIFNREEDFHTSSNPGFFLPGTEGQTGLYRADGQVTEITVDGNSGTVSGVEDLKSKKLIETIVQDHSYLLGPVEL